MITGLFLECTHYCKIVPRGTLQPSMGEMLRRKVLSVMLYIIIIIIKSAQLKIIIIIFIKIKLA
jgi:hypothetical protein